MSFESLGTFAPGAVGIFDPKAPRELKGPHDRHCVECGLVIYRQAKERLGKFQPACIINQISIS